MLERKFSHNNDKRVRDELELSTIKNKLSDFVRKIFDWTTPNNSNIGQAKNFDEALISLIHNEGKREKLQKSMSELRNILNNLHHNEHELQKARHLSNSINNYLEHYRPRIIIQPGYANGDRISISATLLDNPNSIIVISKCAVLEKDNQDQSASIIKYYMDMGISEKRIKLIEVDTIRNNEQLKQKIEMLINSPDEASQILKFKTSSYEIADIYACTKYVSKFFDDELRQQIRKAWMLERNVDNEIKQWLSSKGICDIENKKVIILWSKFGGKQMRRIHMEHDTSFEGIRQIASRVLGVSITKHHALKRVAIKANSEAKLSSCMNSKDKDTVIIIAGDRGVTENQRKKYSEMERATISQLGEQRLFDLTEFWKDCKNPYLAAWGGDAYSGHIGQYELYDYLNRNSLGLKHLGFRSGNLEAISLMGHEVRYLEEPNSYGSKRMESWNISSIGYLRIKVDNAPTASGKYLKEIARKFEFEHSADVPYIVPENIIRPEWVVGKRNEYNLQKPQEISSYQKGFSENDLDNIIAYLADWKVLN